VAAEAGVVLVGGRSTRMGESKACLEWHGSTLLRRVVGVLARAVEGPVVVVRAPGQALPPMPDGVDVVVDDLPGRGPVQGIASGLAAVAPRADAAFVCSVDLPFLHPAFVRRVLADLTEGVDVVLPLARGHRQPLAAAYRTTLASLAARLVVEGRNKPAMLFELCEVRVLTDVDLLADAELAIADPALDSLQNVNLPEDYRCARDRPGPQIVVQCYGEVAEARQAGPRTVRATTLGAAAEAVGLTLDRHVVAALNGATVTQDAELPLVAGDTVAFLSAEAGA